jgi:hypothetical protein
MLEWLLARAWPQGDGLLVTFSVHVSCGDPFDPQWANEATSVPAVVVSAQLPRQHVAKIFSNYEIMAAKLLTTESCGHTLHQFKPATPLGGSIIGPWGVLAIGNCRV